MTTVYIKLSSPVRHKFHTVIFFTCAEQTPISGQKSTHIRPIPTHLTPIPRYFPPTHLRLIPRHLLPIPTHLRPRETHLPPTPTHSNTIPDPSQHISDSPQRRQHAGTSVGKFPRNRYPCLHAPVSSADRPWTAYPCGGHKEPHSRVTTVPRTALAPTSPPAPRVARAPSLRSIHCLTQRRR